MGHLEKVDLRESWQHKANDFPPWPATVDTIQVLGEAIDMELEVESSEEPVGPFRADILCKDASTNNWVLVENQLERTDQSPLGHLLTYAAGLSCVTIVWIAQRFTNEHSAALDWLNDKTEEGDQLLWPRDRGLAHRKFAVRSNIQRCLQAEQLDKERKASLLIEQSDRAPARILDGVS